MSRLIAVDTNPKKESWVKQFGGENVEFINPASLPEGKKIQEHLVEITDGGLDFTFDATGNVSLIKLSSSFQNLTYFFQVNVMRAALEACHKGWGVSTIIGVAVSPLILINYGNEVISVDQFYFFRR